MQHLIDDVRRALDAQAWYAAMALALALPDIASNIETGGRRTGERYEEWIKTYFLAFVTPEAEPYLHAREVYRLRCKFLHEGTSRLPAERDAAGADYLDYVELQVSRAYGSVPALRATGTGPQMPTDRSAMSYGVAVTDFCEWLCSATEMWLKQARADPRQESAMASLLRIRDLSMFEEQVRGDRG